MGSKGPLTVVVVVITTTTDDLVAHFSFVINVSASEMKHKDNMLMIIMMMAHDGRQYL